MELILKQDVENLGFKDDVVQVKNGYGRNFLIPQGLAILATPSAKKVLAENLKQRAFKEKKLVDDASALGKSCWLRISKSLQKLEGLVNYSDQSIKPIWALLLKMLVMIEKKCIKIKGGSVKVLGDHEAEMRLHREVKIQLPFQVTKAAEE